MINIAVLLLLFTSTTASPNSPTTGLPSIVNAIPHHPPMAHHPPLVHPVKATPLPLLPNTTTSTTPSPLSELPISSESILPTATATTPAPVPTTTTPSPLSELPISSASALATATSPAPLSKCDYAAGFGELEGTCVRLCRANSCGCSNDQNLILNCVANGICSVSPTTNAIQCKCNTGYDGLTCKTCTKGSVGYPECLPFKKCPSDCLNGGECDGNTGRCNCPSSTNGGATCSTCASGYTVVIDATSSNTFQHCAISPTSSIWGFLWFLILFIVGCGLFAALAALAYKRHDKNGYGRRKRQKYHGIPTEDLDEARFSFQDDGIDLGIPGLRSNSNSMDDVLLVIPSSDESDIDLGDMHSDRNTPTNDFDRDNEENEKGNDAADEDDFKIEMGEDGLELELSDDDDTGFAGW